SVQYIKEKVSGTCSFIEQNTEYLIPIAQNINVEEELKKLNADLEYAEKFLQSVLKKLANERFVSNAPEQVVAVERKKQSDAEEKIRMLKEQIANLQ
ncbi:MAG: valine--tRNA ligase, partial [Bacteroidales bacterium]|nr:valine--tRNA ligase [Bacteroidales bacterium]